MNIRSSKAYKESIAFAGELFDFLNKELGYKNKDKVDEIFLSYLESFIECLEEKGDTEEGKRCFYRAKQRLRTSLWALFDLVEGREVSEELNQEYKSRLRAFFRKQERLLFERKKILILTTKAGNGHKSAANAITEGLKEVYGFDYDVECVDVIQEYLQFYEPTMRYVPGLYKWMFDATDTDEALETVHAISYPLLASRLDNIVKEHKPDIIVTTFFFFGIKFWLKDFVKKQDPHIPFITVVTDSISIHQSWILEYVDHYICTNEETKDVIVEKGIPKEKVHALGFPVQPKFYENFDRDEELAWDGITKKKLNFLVIENTGSMMKDVEFLQHFDEELGKDANCLTILGSNEHLYKALKKKDLGESVHLYGWVNDMYRMMHMADVIVTKAGGATVMECVALNKPMIITKILPGQEEGNAELVKKYDLGTVMDKENNDLLGVMKHYVQNLQQVKKKEKNFKKTAIPEATFKIADFIVDILEKK